MRDPRDAGRDYMGSAILNYENQANERYFCGGRGGMAGVGSRNPPRRVGRRLFLDQRLRNPRAPSAVWRAMKETPMTLQDFMEQVRDLPPETPVCIAEVDEASG